MTSTIRFTGLTTLAALCLACSAQALAAPADLKARADAFLQSAYPVDGPGAAVIIVERGKTVYAGGRGLADVAGGRPIGPDTVFRLGSITKQFSSAVLLQLADEGKLSLDDPISRYVPGLAEPGASATVRQALNHTIGVQSYTAIPGWMREENTARARTTDEMIALFKDLPSPTRPGEAWAYNNSGYVLVGAIIEKVTGKPWHQVVRERIAAPLGLETIRYGVEEPTIASMATGYTLREEGVAPAVRIHMSVPHAAGALVGTVGDLAAWGQALHHGKVLKPASYAAMIAPTRLPNGETVPYGFGMGTAELRGRQAIGHGGGIFGFTTDSTYLPKDDLFVAVFTNSDKPATHPGVAMRRLAALALGEPYPEFAKVDVPAAALEPLFGSYTIDPAKPDAKAEQRLFYARDGKLYTKRSGAPELEAFAAGGDRFFYGPNSLTWFRVARDSSGAHVLEMHDQGEDKIERAVRSGPVPAEPKAAAVPREVLQRYLGRYAIGAAHGTIAWGKGDSLTIQLAGQPALPLRAVSETEFDVPAVDARIAFESENGAVARLVIDQGGRKMAAERVKEDVEK
ncbi:class A beta-lactamase-related serine hydrolase [Sphingomonas parva]|uniref:Class A beta-lactamase-related serine hydrolase n=1 Tax=Sphingomonas parva TaxID=2555898 RepID=A0A4Y8ZUG2_9SPHN|nr:serine hydrolase domain-containing protein [Sphingomonas parva]TFI58096.1 class A beta-lactamase-related serine hydrolase [Sphingomonas parva]